MLRRPRGLVRDAGRCLECGLCEALVPGRWVGELPLAADAAALDALACCPTGAIGWLEGDSPVTTLDVTTLPPRERHPRIFALFDALAPGEAFELVNDHDPRPLYYQFQAERPHQALWEPLEQGPLAWRIRITRADPA